MWAGISVQPSGFIFGAALLGMGLSLGETAAALMIGNLLLLGPLVLNALPGAKYVSAGASTACAFVCFSHRVST
jgi:cytosine/uracil/thiamine/allantoin permease